MSLLAEWKITTWQLCTFRVVVAVIAEPFGRCEFVYAGVGGTVTLKVGARGVEYGLAFNRLVIVSNGNVLEPSHLEKKRPNSNLRFKYVLTKDGF